MKAMKLHAGKEKASAGTAPADWTGLFDAPLPSLLQDQGRWMDRWFRASGFPAFRKAMAPAIDVGEDDKEVLVKAEVPGLSEKDLEVTFADGMLRLKGEKKGEREHKGKSTWHKESWQGSFLRTIPLGDRVEWSKAQARHKDGILTIIIPKKPGAAGTPVKIEIR